MLSQPNAEMSTSAAEKGLFMKQITEKMEEQISPSKVEGSGYLWDEAEAGSMEKGTGDRKS